MNLNFLPFGKKDIPERNDELKPFFKDTLDRVKQGDLTKKEQAALVALLVVATSGIGYGAFIHAPLNQQEALKRALETTPVHAQTFPDDSEATVQKETLKETEVEHAINEDIASDPNVAIASEEVVAAGEGSGNVNLVMEHDGASDTLTQYLETIENLSYQVNIDSLSYQKDPSNMESTSIRLSIPYEVVDGSLASKQFDLPDTSTPETSTPETTATPAEEANSSGSSSTSSAGTYTPSYGSSSFGTSSSSGSWTPSRSTPATTVTPASGSSASSSTSQAQTKKNKDTKPKVKPKEQVKPQSETPPMRQETTYLAPALTRYSIFDGILSVSSPDGLEVNLAAQTEKTGPKESQIAAIQFTTSELQEGAESVSRVIHMDTGGFYLPKNGYEFSVDVATDKAPQGEFSILVADLSGQTKEVLASRTADQGDGFTRLFFPLNGMDGTKRVVQLRYRFTDPGALEVTLPMRNIQILSHEN